MITAIKDCIVIVLCIFFEYTVGHADLDLLFMLQWLWYKLTWKCTLKWVLCSSDSWECHTLYTVIHLQLLAYGSYDSLFPISTSPATNLWVQNTFLMTSLQYYCILGLAEIKTLHPRDKMMRKRCRMRRQQNHCCIVIVLAFSLTLLCDIDPFFTCQYFWLWQTYIYMTLLE